MTGKMFRVLPVYVFCTPSLLGLVHLAPKFQQSNRLDNVRVAVWLVLTRAWVVVVED